MSEVYRIASGSGKYKKNLGSTGQRGDHHTDTDDDILDVD